MIKWSPSIRLTRSPVNRPVFLERDSQSSLSGFFFLLFWNNHIRTHLVSRKKQHLTSHHRKQLLVSFLEGFLKRESCRNLAKQAHCIEEVLARTQTPVEQVTSVESTQKDSRLDTLSSELNELKCFFKGRLTLSSQKMLMFSQSHNLLLGGQHPRSVFLVDLPHIFIGTTAVHLLSGEEGVAKAASTVAVLMFKEEPKHVLPEATTGV